MLKDRNELEKKLLLYINENSNSKQRQQWYIEIEEKYNIPISMSSDIISGRKDISEYNTFILYCITSVIKENEIQKYYTDNEIKMFSNEKYVRDEISFPIVLDMFKVSDDQYIGVSSVKFLMQLRAAQLINYNAETQRALEIITKGEHEIYRPYLNNKAVKEIKQAYASKSFIPNTISLNISLDDENADYNFADNKLTIKSITAFDIFDGYHRYVAMGQNYDADPDFDYPIELRITMFSVGRAKQFIYQEDQKTKMKKVVSKTYNQHDIANIIINKIDSNPDCYLHNNINNNDGIVNAGYMYNVLSAICLNQKFETKDIFQTVKRLVKNINDFLENNNEYLEKKWSAYETYIIIFGLYNDNDPKDVIKCLKNTTESQAAAIARMYTYNVKFKKMIEEVYSNE